MSTSPVLSVLYQLVWNSNWVKSHFKDENELVQGMVYNVLRFEMENQGTGPILGTDPD